MLFSCLSIVNAQDLNETNNVPDLNDIDEVISTPQEDDFLCDGEGNYNELKDLVSKNTVVDLTKDYIVDSQINIAESVTINGNGHTIDASGKSRIFRISASDVVLNNITFINGNASDSNLGGAIIISNCRNISILNCNFINNVANHGGAIYCTDGNDIKFINNSFIQNKAIWGHSVNSNRGYNYKFINNRFIDSNNLDSIAIYGTMDDINFESNLFNNISAVISIWGSNIVIDKSNFTNANSNINPIIETRSGVGLKVTNSVFINCSVLRNTCAISALNNQSNIENCYFDNVSSINHLGGGVCISSYSTVNNCFFNNCHASSGGAVYSFDHNLINNITIQNCEAELYGAGIYTQGVNNTVRDVRIVNSSTTRPESRGGSIFWYDKDGVLENIFICNSSSGQYAGSIYIGLGADNIFANNITILNSKANIGGGIFWAGDDAFLNNIWIDNADAYHSGALYVYGNNITISNSNFTNNHANYGAGAIGTMGDNVKIVNSNFINNHANNYGGTLSVTDALVENVSIKNTSAVFGGAIFTINSTIKNVNFEDYSSLELGSKIFAINKVNIIDSVVADDELYQNYLTETLPVSGVYKAMFTTYEDTQYNVFTDEWYLRDWNPGYYQEFKPRAAILDPSFKLLRNRLDSSDISEYVKLLLYYYSSSFNVVEYSAYVLGDTDYKSSVYGPIVNVLSWYEQGYRAPDIVINDDYAVIYEYYGLISPTHFKNVFFMKTKTVPIGLNVTKECLNDMIIIGDAIQFRINVTNTGELNLTNIYLKEIFDNSQLKFLTDSLNSNWTFNETSNKFTYQNKLNVNETVSLILSFKALLNGTITNHVDLGWNNKTYDNASVKIRVYNPNVSISKIALPNIVAEGSSVEFEIVVHNTGDIDLTDICIVEDSYDGLTYAGYHATSVWSYAFVNGKHTWYLNEDLLVGADHRLFVYFNTTSIGNFTNYAIVKSNQTKDKKVNATVKVLEHSFTVEKVALNSITKVGDQTVFEIVVHNTGETDLNGVFVIEDSYDGLIFDHVRQATRWSQSTTADGKLKWTFNEVLPSHEWVFLFMVFNTTTVGNFTNTVIAGSDNTINKTSNATVWVNETVYKPEGDTYNLDISITTIHPVVIVGNQTMFEIIVHNTGNTILHNVTVAEHLFDDLIFDSFKDYTGYWTKLPTPKLSSNGLLGAVETRDLTWQMNDILYAGEYTGFFVVFNTTKTGTFSNTVLGSSDETNGKFASDTVDVVKPDYTIEKSLLNENIVYVDDEIQFQVLIHNIGQVNLTNLIIKESPESGLELVRFIDEDEMWIQDGLTFRLKENVLPGEEVGFEIVFKTSIAGTFINTVVSSIDFLDDKTDSAKVRVVPKEPIYDVSIDTKVIDSPVYVGEHSLVEIIVKNTGNDDLDDVFVSIDLNTAIPYLSYNNGSRNWTKSGNIYHLNGILKIGETATFYILVDTTKSGNFSGVASVGFNNTTKDNSTFVIEVLDNETSAKNNDTEITEPIVPDNNTNNKTNDKINNYKNVLIGDNKATGNPILLMLVVLLNLVILRRNK